MYNSTVCLLILFFSFSLLQQVPALAASPSLQHIILIDAGSSGTRIHIHTYNIPNNSSLLPIIYPSNSLKVKPGLSSHENNPQQAAQTLLPLLEFALNHVPSDEHSHTPIYLYATAGLRSIPSILAQEILNQCRLVLKQYPFFYNNNNVRLISGVEEGIAGWIATNYLLGNFNQTQPNNDNVNDNTVGLLEMGGASFQITYSPVNISIFDSNQFQLLTVSVGIQNYKVFTASYLNYGLEKAQALYLSLLSSQFSSEGDPCYPRQLNNGKGDYLECISIVDSLIHMQEQHRKLESNEEKLKEIEFAIEQQKEHELYTEQHNSRCAVNDKPAHSSTNSSAQSFCKFGGYPVPPIQPSDHFLAIENFFYTSEFFSLLNSSDIVAGLRKAGSEFCDLDWQTIQLKYPLEPISDLTKYCFSAAYLVRVLEIGLGYAGFQAENVLQTHSLTDVDDDVEDVELNNAQEPIDSLEVLSVGSQLLESLNVSVYSNIRFVKFVNGVQLDWALGAVLQLITDQLYHNIYHNTTNS
jgi:Golgi nucleoside diphosphatase